MENLTLVYVFLGMETMKESVVLIRARMTNKLLAIILISEINENPRWTKKKKKEMHLMTFTFLLLRASWPTNPGHLNECRKLDQYSCSHQKDTFLLCFQTQRIVKEIVILHFKPELHLLTKKIEKQEVIFGLRCFRHIHVKPVHIQNFNLSNYLTE